MKSLNSENSTFVLTDETKEELKNNTSIIDWEKLIEACAKNNFTPKDVIILKLYFAFLGHKWIEKNTPAFVKDCQKYLMENRNNLSNLYSLNKR